MRCIYPLICANWPYIWGYHVNLPPFKHRGVAATPSLSRALTSLAHIEGHLNPSKVRAASRYAQLFQFLRFPPIRIQPYTCSEYFCNTFSWFYVYTFLSVLYICFVSTCIRTGFLTTAIKEAVLILYLQRGTQLATHMIHETRNVYAD